MRGIATLFTALFVCLASPVQADQFHRLFITLKRLPSDIDEARVNLWVLWGADMAPTDRQPEWHVPLSESVSMRRRSSEIELKPLTFEGPDEMHSALVYGTITNGATGTTVRVIPALIIDLAADDNDVVRSPITTQPDFSAAFRASYPFYHLRDRRFVNDDTVRPTLVAVRYFIEEAGRNDYRLSEEEWGRIRSFFLLNASYFSEGGADYVLEILNYFHGFSGISGDVRFHRFYAEFLNTVLDQIDDRKVNDQWLHGIVAEYLNSLYSTRIGDTFEQADLTLQTLEDREYFLRCIDLSRTILANMNRGFLETANAPLNIRSILGLSNRCGQLLYHKETGESANDVDGAARHLAEFSLGESMMKNFVRVIGDLDDLGELRVTDQRDSLLGTYFRAYTQALGGQG